MATDRLGDRDWSMLLDRIADNQCTPFLGAGASAGTMPLGSELAAEWAESHGYPMRDSGQLSRVAQFLAVDRDAYYPKGLVQKSFQNLENPDFSDPANPHGVLADLDLPIYLTTNYDDLMEEALRARKKEPRMVLCRWNDLIETLVDDPEGDDEVEPTSANPVVYHLHGHYSVPQSLVLTEDDYLDFLVRLSREQQAMLPAYVRTALAATSLLFVGYSLSDFSFRVLFRGLVSTLGVRASMASVAVQLMTSQEGDDSEALERAKAYMDEYFNTIERIKVKTYWGPASEFARALGEKWTDFQQSQTTSAV